MRGQQRQRVLLAVLRCSGGGTELVFFWHFYVFGRHKTKTKTVQVLALHLHAHKLTF